MELTEEKKRRWRYIYIEREKNRIVRLSILNHLKVYYPTVGSGIRSATQMWDSMLSGAIGSKFIKLGWGGARAVGALLHAERACTLNYYMDILFDYMFFRLNIVFC